MTGSFHEQGQLSIETRLESQALAGYACQVSTFDAPFSMIGSLIRPATRSWLVGKSKLRSEPMTCAGRTFGCPFCVWVLQPWISGDQRNCGGHKLVRRFSEDSTSLRFDHVWVPSTTHQNFTGLGASSRFVVDFGLGEQA